jgi:nicotinate-nucleotide adenylyltransferase
MQRLGLFGGAFNPVHLGHLLVAQAAVEELELDRLVFIPACQSPFKQEIPAAPAEMRLQWLRLALAGQSKYVVDDQEIRRGGVSYTIQTVRDYAKKFPHAKLFWLIGADNVPTLNKWAEANELAKLAEFAAIPRLGKTSVDFPRPFQGRMLKGYPLEISSSEIRARVKAGRSIEAMVPTFVVPAIQNAGVYL